MNKLKSTGVMRRIDGMGRIVVPKELCKQMKIVEGQLLEFFVSSDGAIVLKPYSPFGADDWKKAKAIGEVILDKAFAIYDSEGNRQARTLGADTLPEVLEKPEHAQNCYEISDGENVYAYLVLKSPSNNGTMAAKALFAYLHEED